MNAAMNARAAYGGRHEALRTPRDIEYDALARATRALTMAAGSGRADGPRLAEALTLNRRLWMTLATDLAGDGNGLAHSLRADLLGLAQFILNHSERVQAGRADLQPLIDVNMAIMRGLRGDGGNS